MSRFIGNISFFFNFVKILFITVFRNLHPLLGRPRLNNPGQRARKALQQNFVPDLHRQVLHQTAENWLLLLVPKLAALDSKTADDLPGGPGIQWELGKMRKG